MSRLPDLFIIGAPKSGTTSLYEWLKGHPEVFICPVKEPRYFAPDLAIEGQGHDFRYGVDHGRYLALFAGARAQKRLGEASVRYIYSRQAPHLIHEHQPDAYIVACVRDPVELIHALHNQSVSEGVEPVTDFEQALVAEAGRLRGEGVPAGIDPLHTVYLERGRLADRIATWIDVFGRQRVHIVVMEDLARDPACAFRALLEFLSVDPEYQPETFAAYNASHQPRSRVLRALSDMRLAHWVAWRLLPRVLGDARTHQLVRAVTHLNRRAAPRAPMSAELRRQLEAHFAPDVARLSDLVGRDLAALWWGARL